MRVKDEPSPSRKIFPFAMSPSKSPGSTYGDKNNKLHGTYFKDETHLLNKKRYDNNGEKKKKKGTVS